MAVKLHRCRLMWLKIGAHPCWNVQKALDEQSIEYEVVKGPLRDRSEVKELTGQAKYPAIEFEDGSVYREESAAMVQEIRDGKLFQHAGRATG
jgi:glutathione S-transferase